ncbi:MAG: hypothetical protein LBU62_02100 [Bacteroidales bacterium]|nr:hypothetical protein [Bacteroidales bacterium]
MARLRLLTGILLSATATWRLPIAIFNHFWNSIEVPDRNIAVADSNCRIIGAYIGAIIHHSSFFSIYVLRTGQLPVRAFISIEKYSKQYRFCP